MYPNLEDKEILKTVLSGNFGSEKEKSTNVKENPQTKNYEWSTEVRNGVHYNRLDKVKKQPEVFAHPEEGATEHKNEEGGVKPDCLDRCNQTVCFALLFFLFLLSLSFSFFIWYLCAKEKLPQTIKEENIGAMSTNKSLFDKYSPHVDKSSHTTLTTSSSSLISESPNDSQPSGLYVPL